MDTGQFRQPEILIVCSPEDVKDYRALWKANDPSRGTYSHEGATGHPIVISTPGSFLEAKTLEEIFSYLKTFATINKVWIISNAQDTLAKNFYERLRNRPDADQRLFRSQFLDAIRSFESLGTDMDKIRRMTQQELGIALNELMVMRLAFHFSGQRTDSKDIEQSPLYDILSPDDLSRVFVGGFISDNSSGRLRATVRSCRAGEYADKMLRITSFPSR
ncbi:MAG: hypothetical protein U0R17_01590 [Acidimicrobiia bacterium]